MRFPVLLMSDMLKVKHIGLWSYGGQDETCTKREVEAEVAERLKHILLADPVVKARKPRVPRVFG
jgi:hypothetical protein